MPSELSLRVVGAQYPNPKGRGDRRFEILLCAPGDPVELVPEPKNPADPHAIAVFSERDIQIGYITAERAPWIGGMMRDGRGVIAIFQAGDSFGAWIRVNLEGSVPTLPTPQPARRQAPARAFASDGIDQTPEQDFYPDEVWPD